MTIEQANSIVADLLDEETAEEYVHKLPDFYDHAQKQIATTVGYIERVIDITPSADEEIDVREHLLADTGKKLYRVARIISDATATRIYDGVYQLEANNRYRFLCYVYPETVTEDTEPTYEFEIPEEALPALTYYAAAQSYATDNDKAPYYMFMDRYNNILQNMSDARKEGVTINIVNFGGEKSGI